MSPSKNFMLSAIPFAVILLSTLSTCTTAAPTDMDAYAYLGLKYNGNTPPPLTNTTTPSCVPWSAEVGLNYDSAQDAISQVSTLPAGQSCGRKDDKSGYVSTQCQKVTSPPSGHPLMSQGANVYICSDVEVSLPCSDLPNALGKIREQCHAYGGGSTYVYDNGNMGGPWVQLLPDLDCSGPNGCSP